jgi:hypothetical protein
MKRLQTHTSATLQGVRGLIADYRVPVSSEASLQAVIFDILTREMPSALWQREFRFNAKDRIDLWSPVFGVGIEVKIDGGLPGVIRQLQRYTVHDCVNGLALVTTKWRLLLEADTIGGKPFDSVYVGGSL